MEKSVENYQETEYMSLPLYAKSGPKDRTHYKFLKSNSKNKQKKDEGEKPLTSAGPNF